ncbi:MAG: hypothetical protein KZQ60_04435 [Candidatus Thiodiazotropha sp. (ex Lucinoma aequizonata)]|nr:hypothetical protein [Candidatus Thiodiazotropha sp. (ex Lucinoma aequizonata)]
MQYGIVTYAGRSGQNRLSKIELILVDWDVPKSFRRSKTRLLLQYPVKAGFGSNLGSV